MEDNLNYSSKIVNFFTVTSELLAINDTDNLLSPSDPIAGNESVLLMM